MNWRISRLADRDLDQIWSHIAADNPKAADRVDRALLQAMRELAQVPGMGHRHKDVPDERYRFWKVYSYLIAYRMEGTTLVVVRVVHGARDLRKLFRRQPNS